MRSFQQTLASERSFFLAHLIDRGLFMDPPLRRTSFPTQRRSGRSTPVTGPFRAGRARSALRRRAPAMRRFAVNCEENPSWNPKLAMGVDSCVLDFVCDQSRQVWSIEIAGVDAIRESEMNWRRHNRHYRWLGPEQTLITNSCGFNHLSWHIALAKLRTMTASKVILCGRLRRHS
jgi:hypothetical protein